MKEWINSFIGFIASILGIFTFFGISSFDEFLKSPIEKIAFISVSVLIVPVVIFYLTKRLERKKTSDSPPQNQQTPQPTDKIDISRLPNPSAELVGRSKELTKLTNALKNKKLVHICAGGGVGKSALIFEWLQRMQPKKYHDVEKVFAWSFYSQGSHDTQNSSIDFFQKALPFFGHTGEFPKDDVMKGRALAKCLRNHSFILILDGLEPLQHPAHILDGALKDTALKAFLDDVHYHGLEKSPSLIVISSRQPLLELDNWSKEQYVEIDLQTLSSDDGVKLFKKLKVTGTDQELKRATEDMGGHALALVLLGKMLISQFGGDIARRDQLPALWEEEKLGGHAKRVLAWYATYWKNSIWVSFWLKTPLAFLVRRLESKERSFLNLLSLFDRPMGLAEKNELVKYAECAAPLRTLNDLAWQRLEKTLENAGLLLHSEGMRTQWDCHPLIRSYFGQQFKKNRPDQFRQAHLVLFEYYQKVPQKQQPDTLEELEPLYRAVVHGCLAGEYRKADFEVYFERILRGGAEAYSLHKLGAYSQDLTALAAFFPQGWSQPVQQGLSEADQAWLLAAASFCLMSLGRLTEAVEPRQASLKMSVKQKDWKNASIYAHSLVDLLLPLGRLEEAATAATQAIDYAEKNKDLFQQMASYAYRATVLHRQGQSATKDFEKAEQLQQQRQTGNPQLLSLLGFRYCAWLLDQPQVDLSQVVARGEYALNTKTTTPLLDKPLNSLTLACAYRQLGNTTQATDYFEKAVSGIREANQTLFLSMFLIDRANFYLDQQQFDDALRDLTEAWQIIKRSDMKLYAVDYHLAMSRYARVQQPEKVQFHENEAKELIEATGYHLRKV